MVRLREVSNSKAIKYSPSSSSSSSPPSGSSFLEQLNEEMIQTILEHLDPFSLKAFSLTCKSFHSAESIHRRSAKLLRADLLPCVLRRFPNLVSLDLSLLSPNGNGTGVDDTLLRALASSSSSSSSSSPLRSLKLTLCGRFVTRAGMTDLVTNCPNLVSLDLSHSTELTDSAAAAIAGAHNLQRLSLLRCKQVSDMGIGCIAVGCTKLTSLSLKWCIRVTDLGVGLVALKCRHLRSFDLSFVPITEKCLEPILQLPHLHDLVLVGCLGLDDDGLVSLNEAPKALKTLDLSNCQNISHIGLSKLTRGAGSLQQIILSHGSSVTVDVAKCLQTFSMIKCLKLDGCAVTCSALRMIGNWSASLTELSFSKCTGVTDEGISSVVKKQTELKKLDITCCRKITSASIECITSLCTSLTSLKMEACCLVSREAFALIGKNCRLLEELDVTDNDVDDEGLKSISRCSRLSSLKIGVCLNITDEGLIQIGKHCARLKEIDLYRAMRMTDAGIAAIAQGCSDLELINTAYCDQVTDASLISLSRCSRMKVLEIRGCPHITSEGLTAISAGCRQLSILDIKKCHKIDNSGMIPLAHYSQNLKQINLSYCSVTDVGLLALASISRLQNMTILHLAGLSPNGLAAALLACGGLKKVKLHTSFKALLPQSLLRHMESRGCVFHWRDKAFQPQVDTHPLDWNLQIGRLS